MSPVDPEKQRWEVIIIGTGMGGATLGYRLARAGKKVLFCEQGVATHNTASNKGRYAETISHSSAQSDQELLRSSGRCTDEIEDISRPRRKQFVPFIGAGTGGSTSLYGMALERLFPSDFFPQRNHPDAADSTLLGAWPITYEDLCPFYREAEILYRVRGTADSIRSPSDAYTYLQPPPLSGAARELFQSLIQNGFHPYRLPLACEFVGDCECCQGYLCARNCKNDSCKICLAPAVEQYGAQLLEKCTVLKLEADREVVTGVVCRWNNRRITLRGSMIILAAGALKSPAILLNSANSSWPNGLANRSGLVGKNLMRHLIDLYAVTTGDKSRSFSMKEFAFNDLYDKDGEKFGSVQSFGAIPPPQVITAPLIKRFETLPSAIATTLFQSLHPLLARALAKYFAGKLILASILEDLPYPDNQVTIEKLSDEKLPKLRIKYRVKPYDKDRLKRFRKRIRAALRPHKVTLFKQAENNERIAHACGTCRFGSDPENSVLDSFNRAHDLINLYVVDASFFPSSGGINPALTIAANALRVADSILERV